MRSICRLFSIAGVLLGASSCSQSFFDRLDALRWATKYTNPESGKEIILVPMAHLGKAERYADVKAYLDNLKAKGYVTFFETLGAVPFHLDTVNDVSYPQFTEQYRITEGDIPTLDTLLRKMRKIVRIHTLGGYTNPENESLPKRFRNGKRVSQTNELIGITTERDIWVDYSLHDLMQLYEAQCGEVALSPYDFETDLNAPYKAEQQFDTYTFTHGLRDRYLQQRILESPHLKIAVVYGVDHMSSLRYKLRANKFKGGRKYRITAKKNQQ